MRLNIRSLLLVILLSLVNEGFAEKTSGNDIVQYLPQGYSYLLYCDQADASFDEFKKSFFWQKYKMTDEGKELNTTFESLDASFMLIGLTFDDLLDIFSEQALLAIWADQYQRITDYLYLVEKKDNAKSINATVERLEFFAVANKINTIKKDLNNYTIYNFNNKVFLANRQNSDYVLISNSSYKIENAIEKIVSQKSIPGKRSDWVQIFKNRNIVLNFNLTNAAARDQGLYYYSFRFLNTPEIEGWISDPGKITNVSPEYNLAKLIPANIGFVCNLSEDLRIDDLIYPFLMNVNTNIYKFDRNYFDPYFYRLRQYPQVTGISGIKSGKNGLNVICVYQTNSRINKQLNAYMNFNNKQEEYKSVPVYRSNNDYFLLYKGYLLVSDDLPLLKASLDAYKENKGFYHSPAGSWFRKKKDNNFFLWMDLTNYLTDKAMKHGEGDKWYYYNAYMKTFKHLYLTGRKKNQGLYFNMQF